MCFQFPSSSRPSFLFCDHHRSRLFLQAHSFPIATNMPSFIYFRPTLFEANRSFRSVRPSQTARHFSFVSWRAISDVCHSFNISFPQNWPSLRQIISTPLTIQHDDQFMMDRLSLEARLPLLASHRAGAHVIATRHHNVSYFWLSLIQENQKKTQKQSAFSFLSCLFCVFASFPP